MSDPSANPKPVSSPVAGSPAPAAPAGAAPAKPAASVSPPPPPPPPVPLPAALSHLKLPLQGVDFALRGVHAEAVVSPETVVDAARQLDGEGFAMDTITGVDWMAQGQMELIYDYYHPKHSLRVAIRARVPRDNPELPSIQGVFPGANWHERETHDFLGIRFTGHPDLSPFLLPEDATYHPLRKDFAL